MFIFAFFLATTATLAQGILFPGFCLMAYAPWIALAILKKPLLKALWCACFAGVIVDLLSDHPFGVHALGFTLASSFLYRFRKHFSADSPLHLPLFSSLVSWVLMPLLLFLLFLFDRRVPFTGRWGVVDLIFMPLADGLYALVWISAPLVLFKKLHRYWELYWIKRNKFSPT